jgi:hypothetical protein
MPLNEATRKTRERWPASFDIEGIPRDTQIRTALLQQRIQEGKMAQVTNSFTVDKPAGPVINDINNPPHVNYNPYDPKNEFPKLVYHHSSGRVLKVADAKEQKAALKRGFDLKPSPGHDYSKISRAGIAPVAETGPKREEEMSAEELAALDEADAG